MKKWTFFSIAGALALLVAGMATLRADKNAAAGASLSEALKGKLVVPGKDGAFDNFSIDKENAPEYFAVYYSAHWCGPCRVFTPELVKFYDKMKKEGASFELIFVSSDTSEKAMHEYMTEDGMKWPALKYSERNSTREITKFAGPGIPCLVVLDAEGKVLAHTFRGNDYLGPEVPLEALEEILGRAS